MFSAVLGAYFLKEELGILGKLGCAICLLGSVIIVLHAPPDEEIENVGQILDHALRPGQHFLHCALKLQLIVSRFHPLLPRSSGILDGYDLPNCP
jgi:magnesium transporter